MEDVLLILVGSFVDIVDTLQIAVEDVLLILAGSLVEVAAEKHIVMVVAAFCAELTKFAMAHLQVAARQTAIVKHAEATDAAEAAVHALMVKHALTKIVFQYFVLTAIVSPVPAIVLAVPK